MCIKQLAQKWADVKLTDHVCVLCVLWTLSVTEVRRRTEGIEGCWSQSSVPVYMKLTLVVLEGFLIESHRPDDVIEGFKSYFGLEKGATEGEREREGG